MQKGELSCPCVGGLLDLWYFVLVNAPSYGTYGRCLSLVDDATSAAGSQFAPWPLALCNYCIPSSMLFMAPDRMYG